MSEKVEWEPIRPESLSECLERLQTTVKYVNRNLRDACRRIEKLEDHICFNKDNREDLNVALRAIQVEYKEEFENIKDISLKFLLRFKNIEERLHDNNISSSLDRNRIEKLERWKEAAIDKNIQDVERIKKLESERLGQELDPQVWVFVSERLDKLEVKLNELYAIVKTSRSSADIVMGQPSHEFNERIAKLESENDHDERIHSLENICAEERLIEIEMAINELKRFQDIERIKTLEQEIIDLKSYDFELNSKLNDILSISNKMSFKKPHKCPMCEGHGKHKHPLNGLEQCECDHCKGEGIIWG